VYRPPGLPAVGSGCRQATAGQARDLDPLAIHRADPEHCGTRGIKPAARLLPVTGYPLTGDQIHDPAALVTHHHQQRAARHEPHLS
jgi:hypothetical protein